MIKNTLSKLITSIALILSTIGCGPEMPMTMEDGGHPDASPSLPAYRLNSYELFFIPVEFCNRVNPSGCPVNYRGSFTVKQYTVGNEDSAVSCTVVADSRNGNTEISSSSNNPWDWCNGVIEGLTLTAKLSEQCPQLQPSTAILTTQIEGLGAVTPVTILP